MDGTQKTVLKLSIILGGGYYLLYYTKVGNILRDSFGTVEDIIDL